jgi:hypothetical protein
MRSAFSSDRSNSMDESENGYLEEDIQTLIKESNKKIQADTKQQKSGKGVYVREYSADKPTSKLVSNQIPADAFRKVAQITPSKVNERTRPVTSVKPARGIDKSKAYELFDESDDERPYKPTSQLPQKPKGLLSQSTQPSSLTSTSQASTRRPQTATIASLTSSSSSRPAHQTHTINQQPQAQAQHQTPSKKQPQQGKEDREMSTETVKKKSHSKKMKLKHKIAMMCYHERSEIPLVKHFVELGEWKRVLRFDDADFTFVNSERKLDWDVALKTMVV